MVASETLWNLAARTSIFYGHQAGDGVRQGCPVAESLLFRDLEIESTGIRSFVLDHFQFVPVCLCIFLEVYTADQSVLGALWCWEASG